MKIALICPANAEFMPYIDVFCKSIRETHNDFTLITWDRLHISPTSKFTYRDKIHGHPRGFFEYYKYSTFVKNILNTISHDRIIVFGIPISFFLKNTLLYRYTGKYIVDVRDYHRIVQFFNFGMIVKKSIMTSISSERFICWLPNSEKYRINHNTSFSNLRDLGDTNAPRIDQVTISCIGAIKDFEINKKLIDLFGNANGYILRFDGDGVINYKIAKHINRNHYFNVIISGKYNKENEGCLYRKADFINMLMSPDSTNNNTCLSNRLYNSAIFGRPLIALHGSYVAELIEHYKLGIVVRDTKLLPLAIASYRNSFRLDEYERARTCFLSKIILDNEKFKEELSSHLK